MSDATAAGQIVGALSAAAKAAAERDAPLVSVEITSVAQGDVARTETWLVRKTRTLLFMGADAFDADGARIASASSVHRLRD